MLASRTAGRLQRAIAVHAVIAWRIMLMARFGRQIPTCDDCYRRVCQRAAVRYRGHKEALSGHPEAPLDRMEVPQSSRCF